MKNVLYSVLIVFVVAAAVVTAFTQLQVSKEIGQSAAGVLVTAIPFVHQLLQSQGSKLSLSARKRGVVSLSGYAMPWYLLALYGALILVGTTLVVGAMGGLAAALAGVPPDRLVMIMALGNIPVMICAYLVGKWIGARAESKGPLAFLIAAISVPIVDRIIALTVVGRAAMAEVLHTASMVGLIWMPIVVTTVLLSIPGFIGYWRGRKQQMGYYLAYLLRALPQDSRDTLVALAYDEANRLAPPKLNEVKVAPPRVEVPV